MPKGIYVRTPEIKAGMSGKNHHNYKSECHTYETRICGCPDHESFTCLKSSKQIYIKGHSNKGTIQTKESNKQRSITETGKIVSEETKIKQRNARLGKKAYNYKPENHILETRYCECKCDRTFECAINSKKRYLPGHNANCQTKETLEKKSKSMVGKFVGEKSPLFNTHPSKETRKKSSDSHKGNHLSEKSLKKWAKSCKLKPNKAEQKLDFILQEIAPNEFKLNVRANVMILGGKIPDFVNINGQKKVIELYGDYWHKGQDINVRIDYFKQLGWDTLIIWEKELKDIENLKLKILEFIQ
jgi:G:T-mismatch repair DNA endonuclease (very short patch repair protein)